MTDRSPDPPDSGAPPPVTAEAEPPGPRYLRIRDALAARLRDGLYPVGSLMPTESDLTAEFGTSRFTVREALRALQEQGWIERRQGVGTRVLTNRPDARYSLSAATLEDLFQLATDTTYVLLGCTPLTLDEAEAEIAGGAPGEDWMLAEGMRWTAPGGRPIAFVQSYFPARHADLTDRFEAHAGPLFALLEAHASSPVEEAVQETSARIMPDRVARFLGQRPGTLALVLLRRYLTAEGVLIASVNWHPAAAMTHVMRIRRGAPPPG